MFADMDESVADMLEYKDDGCIELVLKVLARICDGQHVGLQVYFIGSTGMSFIWGKTSKCFVRSDVQKQCACSKIHNTMQYYSLEYIFCD